MTKNTDISGTVQAAFLSPVLTGLLVASFLLLVEVIEANPQGDTILSSLASFTGLTILVSAISFIAVMLFSLPLHWVLG